MSISKSKKNDLFIYRIRSFRRSKKKSTIRIQKQITIRSQKELSDKKLLKEQQELDELTLRELILKESQGINFGDLIDLWYQDEYHTQRVQTSTLDDYYGSLKKWCRNLWSTPTEKISKRDMKALFQKMENEGKSKSHQQTLKTIINHVFNWGNNEGYIDIPSLPTKGINVKRSSEKDPEILTLEQVKIFLKAAKDLEHDWYPVWAFALLTGCRNGEIYALKWEDVSFENRSILISRSYNNRKDEFKSTKSGNYRTVPINDDLLSILKQLKIQTFSNGFVLPRLSGWKKGKQAEVLRTFLQGIGLPSVRFHTLRACFATMLLSQGQKPAQLMKICGWENLKTMERYIRMAGIDEKGVTDKLQILSTHRTGELLTGTFSTPD